MQEISLNNEVKAFDKILQEWVTGIVTHIYPNGDVQVVGTDSWEGAVVRCKPEETRSS